MTEWTWTPRREQAALEVARDLLPDTAIAESCGVSKQSLEQWKRAAAFQSRVQWHRDHWKEELRALGLSDRQNRVAGKQERYDKLRQVIEERGAAEEMQAVPGGTTGLLVKRVKAVGFGEDMEIVQEYAVDTPTLKEMRELETEVAKELGQWVERKAVEHDDLTRKRELAKALGATEEEAERVAAALASRKR